MHSVVYNFIITRPVWAFTEQLLRVFVALAHKSYVIWIYVSLEGGYHGWIHLKVHSTGDRQLYYNLRLLDLAWEYHWHLNFCIHHIFLRMENPNKSKASNSHIQLYR